MKKPKSMRFVVGSALLVGAPWIAGCPEELGPTSNPVHVEPPPNPVAIEPLEPTGIGVPLPTTAQPPEPQPPHPTANPAARPVPALGDQPDEAPTAPVRVNTRPRHDPPPVE